MQEIELKFLVPETSLKGLMRQVQVKAAITTPMAAHYFDTPDQRLAGAGIGLRIRQEGDTWVQTIKAGGDGIAARLEHNAALDTEHAETMLADDALLPDLSIYKDTAVSDALNNFKRKKLTKALTRHYITDIERTTRLLIDKKSNKDGTPASTIEVAYDVGHIIHGQDPTKKTAIQELELELIEGDVDYLFEMAKTWCKRYKLCLSTVTKAERGRLLINDQDFSPAVHADLSALDINKDISAAALARAIIHNCLLHILPNSSAIAAGSTDADHIKQLNLGLQRLSIALQVFSACHDAIDPDWYPIIKQTASRLDEYDELVTLDGHIEPMLEANGAPALDLTQDMNNVKEAPIDAVRANGFQLTLLDLIAYTMRTCGSDDANSSSDDVSATDYLSQVLNQYLEKLLTDDKAAKDNNKDNNDENSADNSQNEQVQEQLCRLTEMRHISEFAAPLYTKKHDKKRSKRWLKRLNKAQKSLSHYAANCHYYEYYQSRSAKDSTALFGAGWFAAHLDADSHRAQKQLNKLARTKTFW